MFGRFGNLIALFISTPFSTEFNDSKDCMCDGIKLLNRWSVPCSILLSMAHVSSYVSSFAAKLLTDLATVECEPCLLLPW